MARVKRLRVCVIGGWANYAFVASCGSHRDDCKWLQMTQVFSSWLLEISNLINHIDREAGWLHSRPFEKRQ